VQVDERLVLPPLDLGVFLPADDQRLGFRDPIEDFHHVCSDRGALSTKTSHDWVSVEEAG
jgi:hypothetical protein